MILDVRLAAACATWLCRRITSGCVTGTAGATVRVGPARLGAADAQRAAAASGMRARRLIR
jgi:hypothetical protein